MMLIQAQSADFDRVKETYLDVIANTPQISGHAKWVYGKHPNDEEIRQYIEDGFMYLLMDEGKIAGAVAITPQGDDYHPVHWQADIPDRDVIVLHLLCVTPEFQGKGVAKVMLQAILQLGKDEGKKACRLDTLAENIPAQKLYAGAGFQFCEKTHWFYENIGWMDFYLYEILLNRD